LTISGGIITGTGACTTTSTTTTTTTVFSCAQCKTWQYSSIPSGGDIVYYYSCIDGTLQSIGLSDTDPNGTFCNCNSVGNPFTSVSPGGTTLTELGTCDPFATTTTTTSTTTTTTTLGYNSFLLAYSATSGSEACSRYPTIFTNTYYTNPNISVLSNGVTIYQDSSLTSPAGNGFYSNGTNYWNTGAGSGNLQNQTSCNTTTSTTTTTTTTATADVFVQNTSLDVPITDVTVNGISVTHTGGANFPVNAGENGNFQTSQLGTQNVIIYYSGHTSGQNLTFTDSDSNIDCQNLNGGAGSFTIPVSIITGGTDVYVTSTDGACS